MKIDIEAERKEILNRYKLLINACKRRIVKGDRELIRKAFEVAVEAHKEMRRKSGEPYIYHPIAVAQICAEEIGLGSTGIVCALLHDTVEDTDLTLDDVKGLFGEKVSQIINGLTKISGVIDNTSSIQAENFRKVLLTMSEDIRVILIKLADRLHNMRTLEHMAREKQMKIASETLFLYAPLAHRLGLNNIKTELEDLGLKYTNPDGYNDISVKLKETEPERKRFVQKFIEPLKEILGEQGFKFKIFGRPKSIFSIYNKTKTKGVSFEEIYDLFAIRIIIDTPLELEKSDCWKVYSIITDFYHPSPERLRDWISTPKSNGYESLHTTVMGPEGKWVEVQIRTVRMDELAEKGYAAHWKYKDSAADKESKLENWLGRIREMLENPDPNALEFMDDFKLNLFSDELFAFTPKGDMKTLPVGATALDFAFEIHTKVGEQCIGAKVNFKLVPLSYELKSGDQVEILTSNKQTPKEDWLGYVITAKAKSKIKSSLKEQRKKVAEEGREIMERKFYKNKLDFTLQNVNDFCQFLRIPSSQELFYRAALGNVDLKEIKEFIRYKNNPVKPSRKTVASKIEQLVTNARGSSDMLVIGDDMQKLDYKLSPCCNPIPGDDVFGFITVAEGIKIHRVNCPNAIKLLSNYAYRVVKAKWMNDQLISFLAGIKIIGTDELGLVNNITKIISSENNINMRSIKFDTDDGLFEGTIMVYVHDTKHLNHLMEILKKVKGVTKVDRIDEKG
ncbi:bifunctional (p)ppGpp synthetase/guanosine-3',5'-bis(diphosphate) 3'-pyrophosphohydrolase [Sediminibacterium sp.]|uniref:RelA/SpoT family protein n=1 Tax=Sediminibacterium sp. TaxID=1917865 RepID=UPI00273651FA|nr:bifunctional (p)ppGpp synthetase/guanosine-3',5'-bis(diphosphate) 3'-pyrophosphohydrolase [Sediminibacterium sp.]MDP3567592.1 bifunctional (p)ppGpp synthetase/guanosine-3',5'-bis(diphosphate) 3'-pyrophosphohydrolase [Sediminibacterium sp.]